jgi:hypothetical protein
MYGVSTKKEMFFNKIQQREVVLTKIKQKMN